MRSILRGIDEMKEELTDALNTDLGRSKFLAWISECSLIKSEIDHSISSLSKWV